MIKYKKLSEMEKWEEVAYPVVKRIVDKYDTEALLKLGCPLDEYDPITHDIADALSREKLGRVPHLAPTWTANIIALAHHIHFHAWGNKILYHPIYTTMAKDLIKELVKEKLLSKEKK